MRWIRDGRRRRSGWLGRFGGNLDWFRLRCLGEFRFSGDGDDLLFGCDGFSRDGFGYDFGFGEDFDLRRLDLGSFRRLDLINLYNFRGRDFGCRAGLVATSPTPPGARRPFGIGRQFHPDFVTVLGGLCVHRRGRRRQPLSQVRRLRRRGLGHIHDRRRRVGGRSFRVRYRGRSFDRSPPFIGIVAAQAGRP